MVGVAQLAEHSVVVRAVAGSNPVAHPRENEARCLVFCYTIDLLPNNLSYCNYESQHYPPYL